MKTTDFYNGMLYDPFLLELNGRHEEIMNKMFRENVRLMRKQILMNLRTNSISMAEEHKILRFIEIGTSILLTDHLNLSSSESIQPLLIIFDKIPEIINRKIEDLYNLVKMLIINPCGLTEKGLTRNVAKSIMNMANTYFEGEILVQTRYLESEYNVVIKNFVMMWSLKKVESLGLILSDSKEQIKYANSHSDNRVILHCLMDGKEIDPAYNLLLQGLIDSYLEEKNHCTPIEEFKRNHRTIILYSKESAGQYFIN